MTIDSGSFIQFWSRTMQRIHHVKDVYRAIANFAEKEGIMKMGQTYNRPYMTKLTTNPVGASGSYTRQTPTSTNETLTVDSEDESTFYFKDADIIQNSYKLGAQFARQSAIVLGNLMSGKVFGEYDQADSSIDDGDIGGTDGNGLTLTVSNVLKMFTQGNKKMTRLNVDEDNRWALISPEFREVMMQFFAGKESPFGDKVGVRGKVGTYMGMSMYLSNAVGWSARLEMGDIPTANDTVLINGVTFKFVDTGDVDAAGEVYYGGSAPAAIDNLVASINAPGTADSGIFYPVSAANQILLKNITATDEGTYMTLKGTGYGYCVVSETLNASADVWTTTKQLQHVLFGQGRPIDVVVQKYPNLGIFHRDGYIGKDFVTWMLYTIKTFDEGDAQLVDCQIRSDAF